jgi:predicted molibdopterin-dependent oxidoreductase YjgC
MVIVDLDGHELRVPSGVSVAAALLSAGAGWPQLPSGTGVAGLFCGMGTCYGCVLDIDGRQEVRACITPVAARMCIDTHRIDRYA